MKTDYCAWPPKIAADVEIAEHRDGDRPAFIPRFLLRDRDAIYGEEFRNRMAGMRVEEVITALRSPWQSPFVERMIGSIRRKCFDRIVVLGENHLRRILKRYVEYYHSIENPFNLGERYSRSRRHTGAVDREGS